MFVGEKQYFFAALKSPLHHRGGVRTCADRTALLTRKGLDCRCRIHVRDGNNFLRVRNAAEFVPTRFHLPDIGHVRHRATRAQVRKHHHLVAAPQDVRALRHEMDATENNVLRVDFRRLLRELQRIAAKICELHNLVALVVMAKNHDVFAEFGLCRGDSFIQRVIGHQ